MLSTRLLTPLKAAAVAALLCSSTFSLAQDMTAANYIAMDLQARQITLNGVRDRLTLLQSAASLEKQLASDADTQQQVDVVYQRNGMTSSRAIAWATQHALNIAKQRAKSPEQQAEYDRIASELDTVSTQIQLLTRQSR